MVDRVEAQKNLKKLEDDHYHLAHLNHLNSRESFKQDCHRRMNEIREQIENIKWQLDEKPKKTR
ncbi:hypothetical protein [Acinetobacter sp. YH12073]|uniref:hypothetical protein n=1 Tax=Acinetobacter sp. YH12073 TaxID=2601069 RepID=UPI0015D1F2D6|nr:hypothetical protein [Acinetobacter sp. YH12073]